MLRRFEVSKISCVTPLIFLVLLTGFTSRIFAGEENLIAYWNFDEGKGNRVVDHSGQGNDGQFVNDPIYVPGVSNTALEFDGKGTYVKCKANDTLNSLRGSFTIELWFKYLGEGPKKTTWTLLCKNADGNGYLTSFHLWVSDTWVTSGKKSFGGRFGNGKQAVEFLSGGLVEDGKFHHGAIVYDHPNHRYTLYFDGTITAQQAVPTDWIPVVNKDDLTLGQWTAYGDTFRGILDEVKVYNQALTREEIQEHYFSGQSVVGASRSEVSRVVIPKSSQPPTIDGTLSSSEWKDAVKISGFLDTEGMLSDKRAEAYLTHDFQNLYVAVVSDTWDGVSQAAAKGKDGPVFLDDCVDLLVIPDPKKTVYYQITVNPAGVCYDARLEKVAGVEQKNISWNSQVKSNCRIQNKRWVLEMSVPFSAFDLASPRKEGDSFNFTLARTYVVPKRDSLDVGMSKRIITSLTGNLTKTGSFVVATLRGHVPAVSLQISNGFDIGEVSAQLHLTGLNTKDALTYQGEVWVKDSLLVKKEGPVQVPGQGQPFILDIQNQIPPASELQNARLTVKVFEKDGTPLFLRSIPFTVINTFFTFDYLVDRKAGQVLVEVVKQIAKGFENRILLFELITTDGQVIASRRLEKEGIRPSLIQTRFSLSTLPDLVPLRLRVSLMKSDLSEKTEQRNRLDTRHPPLVTLFSTEKPFQKMEGAESVRCTVGDEDTVPWPWSPLEYKDYKISCWNREYDFTQASLLRQAKSAGAELLTGPVILRAESAGRVLQWQTNRPTFRQKDKATGQFFTESVAGNLSLKCKLTVEFDGMIRVDGNLIPTKPVTLDGLSLVIPLQSSIAKYIYATQGDDMERGVTYHKDWQHRIGALKVPWSYQFLPVVWIGNEDKGFCWFAEDDRGWQNANPHKAITVDSEGNATVLRIHYADHRLTLKTPFQFTFGLQATPMRSRPANWREYGRWGTWVAPAWGHIISTDRNYKYWPLQCVPEMLAGEIQALKKRGVHHLVPYSFPQCCDAALPEIRYFLEEWSPAKSDGHPRKLPKGYGAQKAEYDLTNLSFASKSFRNFLISNYHLILKTNPDLKGVYYDGVYPFKTDNPLNGHGYFKESFMQEASATQDVNKTLQSEIRNPKSAIKWCGSYPLFAARDFFKRMYRMVKDFGTDRVVFNHCSCSRFIPLESFCDLSLDGEHLGGDLAANKADYVDVISLDAWRTQYTCRQTGSIPVFLPQIERAFDAWGKKTTDLPELWGKSTRTLLSMILIHDLGYVRFLVDDKETGDFGNHLDRFGLLDAKFLPYWSNQDMVESFSPDVKISLYRKKGKVLVGLANISKTDASGDIIFHLAKLGLNKKAKGEDLVTGTPVTMDGDRIKNVKVPARDYDMILVEQE